MADFPIYEWPPLNVITPFHPDSFGMVRGGALYAFDGAAVSTTFNDELIHYFPFRIWRPSTVVKMSILNGATAAGTFDIGVYDGQLNKIVSTGLTAQSGTNDIQTVDTTDTTLLPGEYLMAVKSTDGTATAWMRAIADELALPFVPLYTEAGGAGAALPTTATPVLSTLASPVMVAIGLHFDTLV